MRPRSWTDDQLKDAVPESRNWTEVGQRLGLVRPGMIARRSLQGHALRLGIETIHLKQYRNVGPVFSESQVDRAIPKDQLETAITSSLSWASTIKFLEKPWSGSLQQKLIAMAIEHSIDYSHFIGALSHQPKKAQELPFNLEAQDSHLRRAAIARAAQWFLWRGHVPLIPLEVVSYDFAVDSFDGFKKIQVKSTTAKNHGHYHVGLTRRAYGTSYSPATGLAGTRAYSKDELDYFFICTPESEYIIPFEATDGQSSLTLGKKWQAFQV